MTRPWFDRPAGDLGGDVLLDRVLRDGLPAAGSARLVPVEPRPADHPDDEWCRWCESWWPVFRGDVMVVHRNVRDGIECLGSLCRDDALHALLVNGDARAYVRGRRLAEHIARLLLRICRQVDVFLVVHDDPF